MSLSRLPRATKVPCRIPAVRPAKRSQKAAA